MMMNTRPQIRSFQETQDQEVEICYIEEFVAGRTELHDVSYTPLSNIRVLPGASSSQFCSKSAVPGSFFLSSSLL
jgi:hypothetical protein